MKTTKNADGSDLERMIECLCETEQGRRLLLSRAAAIRGAAGGRAKSPAKTKAARKAIKARWAAVRAAKKASGD